MSEAQIVTALDDGTVTVTAIKVYQPTLGLRWDSQGVLQQAWQETRTGEIDWRDVPREERKP